MTDAFASLQDRKIVAALPVRSSAVPSWATRTVLIAIVALSVAVSLPTGGSDAAARAGSDLTNLLRFMAVLKAALAVAVLAATVWRLAAPVGLPRFVAYAISSGLMAAGPGLIWGMDHVGLGALLLHGGLITSIVLLWRDPATSDRLRALAVSRR